MKLDGLTVRIWHTDLSVI